MSTDLIQLGSPVCGACHDGDGLGFSLTMAFQPIVNVATRQVFAYEALVRGTDGEGALQVLSRVNEENRYIFDQSCRVKAIELAARLGMAERGARLSVNFIPGAVYSPAACIRRTLAAAREFGFPLESIIFELTENEQIVDIHHLRRIASEYARHGFVLAMDDFGAGFSGLNLFAELDGIGLVKLDGRLVRGMDRNPRALHVVRTISRMCAELGIEILGECVETEQECLALQDCGVSLMQGYLFARPGFELLPEVHWPGVIPFPPRRSAEPSLGAGSLLQAPHAKAAMGASSGPLVIQAAER